MVKTKNAGPASLAINIHNMSRRAWAGSPVNIRLLLERVLLQGETEHRDLAAKHVDRQAVVYVPAFCSAD